jgi:hypothetical protein
LAGDPAGGYFFARARWELDQLGLAVAQLVALLAPPVFRQAALVSPHPSKSALSSQPGKQPLHNYETSDGSHSHGKAEPG